MVNASMCIPFVDSRCHSPAQLFLRTQPEGFWHEILADQFRIERIVAQATPLR